MVRLEADTRRVVVGPRAALATRTHPPARRELDRRRRARATSRAARCSSRCARRARRAPAWLSRGRDGVEVELIDGEEGVAPGPGLRVLRCGRRRGARARRRLHPQRRGGRDAARGAACGDTPDRVSFAEHEGDDGGHARSERGRKGLCALGAGLRLVFGKVFERGRRASIAAAERVGGRILEVGVGTGISLPDYARANRLVGIDISAPMLRKAQERVVEYGLTNVEALAVMDAKHLAFPDGVFDVIVAQYVITAVPDPEATLDEFARVLKPGGEIVLVNHIGAGERPAQARSSRRSRRSRAGSAGGRSSRGRGSPRGKDRTPAIHFIERRPMPPLGHFSLIRYGKEAASPASAAA